MAILVRQYQETDLSKIIAIINHHILHSNSIYDYDERDIETQREIFKIKKRNGYPIFVALIDRDVIGFGTYDIFRPKKGYQYTVEHSIYLDVCHKNKGAGTLLMNALLEFAKINNIHSMIGVIDSKNEASIAFHEKFGFKKVGIIKESAYKFDTWLDSVFMQKIL